MQTTRSTDDAGPARGGTLARWVAKAPRVLGVGAALVGAGHVGAWVAGLMAHPAAGAITMKTNAAVCLVLSGASLALLAEPRAGTAARLVARLLAGVVFLAGLLTLSENLVGWDLGIDQLFASEAPGALAVTAPNRMGTPASTSFAFVGLALSLLGRARAGRRTTRAVQGLGLAVCLVASLGCIGHLYGASELYDIARYTGIAWPTAVALLGLGLGLVAAYPTAGVLGTLTADDAGGRLLRPLLGLSLGLPLVVGYLRLLGERRDLFDPATGTALVMLVFMVVLSTVIAYTARSLSRREAARREAEDAVRESEARYRQLFENMTEGFAVHAMVTDDAGQPCDYVFLDLNPSFESLTGLHRADVVGRRVTEVLPGLDPYWIEVYGRVAASGEPVHFERYTPPPLDRWYEVFAYRPAGGRFAVIFTDITEKKRTEAELSRQREWLRVTLASIGDGVLTTDTDGRVTFLNPVGQTLTGWTTDDAAHRPVAEVFRASREHTREPVEDLAGRVLREGQAIVLPDRTALLTRDGREVPVEGSAAPITDESGRALGVVLVFHDVSERRRAEEALRESESRFRTMGETLPYGVWMANADGGAEYLSQSFLDLLEMTHGELREHGWTHRLPPEDVEPMRARWLHCVRTGEDWDGEHRVLGPDGAYHTVLTRGKPVRDAQGSIVCWVGINLDIDDRKRMEEELRQWATTLEGRVAERTADVERLANQLRELTVELTKVERRERQRLAKILHDHIQQLLVAAKLHLGVLVNRPSAPRLEESARLASVLLDEALSSSRSLTAELSPPVLFDTGLEPALQWLARNLRETHGLAVDVAFDPAGEPMTEDMRVFLFEAARELLFNAVKHARVTRARIDVTRASDGRIHVVVTDEGQGFDPASSGRGKGAGGFGLFSIQQRLRHMGGRLDIDSAPGRGTRIALVAPPPLPGRANGEARAEAGGDRAAEPLGPARRPGGPIRVLIADDHRILREGLAGLLRMQAGIEVVGEASDGVEALEMARRLRPDVVVMDVSMPRMNGIEATREIVRELRGVRVVGLSMHEEGELAAAMREAGAFAYATKGGPSEALVEAIRQAVQRAPSFGAPARDGGAS